MIWLLILCFSGALAQLPDPQKLVEIADKFTDSGCDVTGDRLAVTFLKAADHFSTSNLFEMCGISQMDPFDPAMIIDADKPERIWYLTFGVKTTEKKTKKEKIVEKPCPRTKHYFFLFKGKCENSDGACCSIIQSFGNTENHRYNLKAYLKKYPPTRDLINNNENVIGLEYVPDQVEQMPMPCETMYAAFESSYKLILNNQQEKLEVNTFINDWFIKQGNVDLADVWSKDRIELHEGDVQLYSSIIAEKTMTFLETRMSLKKKLNKKRRSISN